MSRPVVTALYLDELQRAGRQIRLPKNALITPAARDWFRDRRLTVQWIEDGEQPRGGLGVLLDPNQPQMRPVLSMLDHLGPFEVIAPAAPGVGPLASAVRRLCGRLNRREVARGVVFTPDVCVPLVIANKHHGVRAVLGTTLAVVQEACRELAVNLLVIDSNAHAAFQTRQMIERLLAGPSAPPAEMSATVEAIERSGGREDW